MAGSINLSLSQQFDITNGRLLSGGKLYFYSAGTTTPQLGYRDSGLALPHPNPIILGADGRIPQLYFDDGSVRARLVNKTGVVQFDSDNILVIGPSSGGGGGGSVDPDAIMGTGYESFSTTETARSGHVRQNGKTLGSATSGSSERANADCEPLFLYLWPFTRITLVGGAKGGSAAADWAANRQMNLPNLMGYSIVGVDGMGGTAVSPLTGVPFSSGDQATLGSLGGEALNTLDTTKIPAHAHPAFIRDPGHSHQVGDFNGSGSPGNDGLQGLANANNSLTPGGQAITNATGVKVNSVNGGSSGTDNATANAGGGLAHNNTPLVITATFFMKL